MSNERFFLPWKQIFAREFRLVRELTFDVFKTKVNLSGNKKDSPYAVRRKFLKSL